MSHDQRTSLSALEVTLPEGHALGKVPVAAFVVGVIGLGLSVVLSLSDMKQFYHSYLVAFEFFLSIALGALFFVLVQFLARAGWSVVVRRIAENLMATLPLMAVLFIPILVGSHDLFHWTHEEAVAGDRLLQIKAPYLNMSFFTIRAVFYFLVWAGMALWFRKQSVQQDATADKALSMRTRAAAAPAMALFALTTTFSAFDWLMSLDPHWFSTIFGVYFFAGCLVSVMATLSVISLWFRKMGLLGDIITAEHYHDYGKLLFGFTVFWAYIGFCQFFLIWYANIPEETIWFAHRLEGSWKTFSLFLAAGHFVVPFFIGLNRTIKRIPATLFFLAMWMLMMHFIDLYWLVMPNLHAHEVHFALVDFTTLLGVGGLFLGVFTLATKKAALVAHKDPRLKESLRFENA